MKVANVFAEKLKNLFEEAGESKVFHKGDYLLCEGQTERHLYYIETGAVRVFYLSEFEEHTIRLGYEGSFINSLSSFFKETPSEFYIEVIRKSNIRLLSKTDFIRFRDANTEHLHQYINFLELLVTQQNEREIDLLTVSPTQRLERVLKRSPKIFQQIPLKYIASYLRMTPETLSRIRKS